MADNKTAVERGNKEAERRERERKKDMKAGSVAPETSLRPRRRPEPVDVSPNAEANDQEHVQKFRDGGSVRGCKAGQMSGKNFSGTY